MHCAAFRLKEHRWNIPTTQTVWGEPKLNHSLRAVVKSTFVESKTSPSPGLSSPSQDRVQRGSSPSQVQVQMRNKKNTK